jgi:hypothetical protein
MPRKKSAKDGESSGVSLKSLRITPSRKGFVIKLSFQKKNQRQKSLNEEDTTMKQANARKENNSLSRSQRETEGRKRRKWKRSYFLSLLSVFPPFPCSSSNVYLRESFSHTPHKGSVFRKTEGLRVASRKGLRVNLFFTICTVAGGETEQALKEEERVEETRREARVHERRMAHKIRRELGDAVKGHKKHCLSDKKDWSQFCTSPFKILKYNIIRNEDFSSMSYQNLRILFVALLNVCFRFQIMGSEYDYTNIR